MLREWRALTLDALLLCSLAIGVVGVGTCHGWTWCTEVVFWRGVRDFVILWFGWVAWALAAVVDEEH